MDRRKVCILVALLLVFIAIEATTARGQGDGNGNGNTGDGNGNGNTGSGNGNRNNGDGNGNGNNGDGNGNGNNDGGSDGNDDGNVSNGDGNGNGSNGDGNGNGSNGDGNGNGSKGNDNGNGSKGDDNGNGSKGDGNGNGSKGDGNGNGSKGDGNGNGSKGDGNGNGRKGDGNGNGGNGNGSNGNSNGNGSNGNGNNGDGNGHDNGGNGNGNGSNGNGNGNGNNGDGNGNDNKGNGNENGNNSNGNGNNGNNGTGNGNKDEGKDNGKSNPPASAASDFDQVAPVPGTGQERAFCKVKGVCSNKTLTCPSQCPEKKPKNNKQKGCFMDCSSKCEATCKSRKPSCDGYGSVCYDPRFVGGDGIMFYFHGAKGSDFAVVSDDNLQINAHFIGSRPARRTRDFTWVQALSVMFDSHTLVLAAKRVSHWDDKVDALTVRWDGEFVNIPTDGETEWRTTNSEEREVVVERTDATNTVRVTVAGLVEVDVKVTPIGEQENKVHNYQLPSDDAFAHLETQFRYFNLSDLAEGILGKTYRPDYVSPVKRGVPMPTMGGEEKYQTPSLYSPVCKVCRFQRQTVIATI